MIKYSYHYLEVDMQHYTIVKIEGEYAYLRQDGDECGEELFIAMALLPIGADVGSRVKYENLEFTLED